MRVAQVCPRYHPYIGGVETHVKEISERLTDRGFEVEVLTTDPLGYLSEEEVIGSVKVKRFMSWAPSEAYYFSWELRKYLLKNSENYDVVHAHSCHAFPALYAAQAREGNGFIFTPHYHGRGHTFLRSLFHIPYKYIAKRIFEKAEWVICVSNYERSLVMKKFKIDGKKVVVIPNGIHLGEFDSLKREKKNYGVVLYVGRLEKYKGVDYLVKVLPKLDKSICLEIVGKGPHREGLLKLTNKLGVVDRVKFYHDLSIEEVFQKYAEADLFVLLSKFEASGISVAEALAHKTPCIVANASALREWIDEKNCFGIDYPINIDTLAKLINRVIGTRVKLEDLELLNWDEVTDKLAKVYEKHT